MTIFPQFYCKTINEITEQKKSREIKSSQNMVDNLVENSSNQNDLNLKHLNHHLIHSQMSKLVTGDSDNTSGVDNRLKIVQNVSDFPF